MNSYGKSSVTSSLAVDQTPGEVLFDDKSLTAEYLIRQGFHPHPLICLYEIPDRNTVTTTPTRSVKGKPWLIRTGYIGCDPICQLTLKDSKLRDKHSRIKFNTKTDRYVMLDNDTPQGTCLLLSVARGCREKVRLQENDVIEFGNRGKIATSKTKSQLHRSAKSDQATTVKIKVSGIQVMQNTRILERYREMDRRRIQQRKTEFLKKKQDTLKSFGAELDELPVPDAKELDIVAGIVDTISNEQKQESAMLTPEEIRLKQYKPKFKVQFGNLPRRSENSSTQKMHSALNDNDKQVYKGKVRYPAPWQKMERRFTKNSASFTITVVLTVVQGPASMKGKRYTIVDDDITIGSSSSNSICLPNIPGVSPIHAKISRDGRELWLQDLSIGNPYGTKLHLKQRRGVSILPRDIFCIGSKIQLGAIEVSEFPGGSENWTDVAVKVYRTRRSARCSKFPEKSEVFTPRYFLFGDKDELTIGRRVVDCQVSMRDYDMPAFAAMISLFQNRFFIESISENKKKGVFRLIGRGDIDEEALSVRDYVTKDGTMLTALSSSRGPPHHLREGDTIKMGRSLFKVVEIQVETRKDCLAKTAKATEELSKISMFSSLHQSDLALVAAAMSIQSFSDGQRIVQQGKKAYRLYIIRSGQVVISHDHVDEELAILGPGEHFGEMSLLSGITNATCSAKGPTDCLVLDSLSAKSLLSAESLEIVRIFAEKRISDGIFHDLQMCPPFNNFTECQQKAIALRMKSIQYNPGDLIFEGGSHVGKILIVTYGSVSMTSTQAANVSFSNIDEDIKVPLSLLCDPEVIFDLEQQNFVSSNDAVAIVPTTCIAVDIPTLHDILRRSDEELEEELRIHEEHTKATMQVKRLNLETRNVTGLRNRGMKQEQLGQTHALELSNHNLMRNESRAYKTQLERSSSAVGEGEEGGCLTGDTQDDDDFAGNSEIGGQNSSKSGSDSIISDDSSISSSRYSSASNQSCFSHSPSYYDSATDIEESNERVAYDLTDKPFYIILRAISGPLRRSRLILDTPITVFGRCVDEDDTRNKTQGDLVRFISINDRTMSPENSMIEYRSGVFYLCDMQSKFGTFIKLQPGKEYTLEPGDIFDCSQHEFQILAQMESSFGGASACCNVT